MIGTDHRRAYATRNAEVVLAFDDRVDSTDPGAHSGQAWTAARSTSGHAAGPNGRPSTSPAWPAIVTSRPGAAARAAAARRATHCRTCPGDSAAAAAGSTFGTS